MKRFIFIIGGARSGKSAYAVQLAKTFFGRVVFIATAASLDEEMRMRIRKHKAQRPRQWKVIEEGKDIVPLLAKLKAKYRVVLIDCLGLLISNLLADNLEDKKIIARVKKLINAILKLDLIVIVVSNEVGCGIVPDNPLARRFRDLLGLANQMIAEKSNQVILMQSGIPVNIKRPPKNS